MKFYSLMTGCGFVEKCGFSQPFVMAWIGILILVVLMMLGKKWLGEEDIIGYPYNWFGSFIGVIIYIFMISFTGSAKWSLLVGLVGLFGGGFGMGAFAGGNE